MDSGNLSFVAKHGHPYDIPPAYDMTPMAFAPQNGGGLPNTLTEATIHASVANETWRHAEALARMFFARVVTTTFSHRFSPCIAALEQHINTASARIERLG